MTRVEAYRCLLEGGMIVHSYLGDSPIYLAKGRDIREVHTGFGVNIEFMHNPKLLDGWSLYE